MNQQKECPTPNLFKKEHMVPSSTIHGEDNLEARIKGTKLHAEQIADIIGKETKND
jgi:hypothetical protein